MSEQQPLDTEYSIDWSATDLLDACYDPAIHMDQERSNGIEPLQSHWNPFHWCCISNTDVDPIHTAGSNTLGSGATIMTTGGAFWSMNTPIVTDDFPSGTGALLPLAITHGPPEATPNGSQIVPNDGFVCGVCGERFLNEAMLNSHTRTSGHPNWPCGAATCELRFSDIRERDAHQKRPHVLGHGRVLTTTPNTCRECGESLSSKSNLLRHAKEFQHQPYGCECGSSFSRLDVLNRHLDSFSDKDPEYPCKYCKRHRGENGFRRLDHWMQHIRNYHHHELEGYPEDGPDASRLQYNFPVCPHPDCSAYRGDSFKQQPQSIQKRDRPFATQSAFTKHMRDLHNECKFPCDIQDCERVGRRGYFREKDLLKHRREQHPNSPPYQVVRREMKIPCKEPGCEAVLDPSSMTRHAAMHYWEGKRSY